jgi:hypothetical protein
MPSINDQMHHRAPLIGRLEAVTTVAVLGAVGLILGLTALLLSTTKATTGHVGYKQSGAFSYTGNAPAGSLYGSAGLVTGQPIQTGVIRAVDVHFGYRLTSAKGVDSVRGTATLVAKVTAAQGISRSFPIAKLQHFQGPKPTIAGVLPMKGILRYVKASAKALNGGVVTTAATVTITPKVRITGSVGGRPLSTTYAPSLPFALNGSTLALSSQTNGLSSDATGAGAHPLTPSSTASTAYPMTVHQNINLGLAHPSVTQAREIGFGLAILCLLLGLALARPLLRHDGEASERDRIRALYGSLIVPVNLFAAPPMPVADVTSIGALAELAKRYESMIMHRRLDDGDDYTVWDNGLIYRYRIGAPPESIEASDVIDLSQAHVAGLGSFSAAGVRRNGHAPDPRRTR